MSELDREYTLLFNGITDAIEEMQRTIERLKLVQQRAEEEYLAKKSRAGKDGE